MEAVGGPPSWRHARSVSLGHHATRRRRGLAVCTACMRVDLYLHVFWASVVGEWEQEAGARQAGLVARRMRKTTGAPVAPPASCTRSSRPREAQNTCKYRCNSPISLALSQHPRLPPVKQAPRAGACPHPSKCALRGVVYDSDHLRLLCTGAATACSARRADAEAAWPLCAPTPPLLLPPTHHTTTVKTHTGPARPPCRAAPATHTHTQALAQRRG